MHKDTSVGTLMYGFTTVYTYINMQVNIGVCILENQGEEVMGLGQHNTTLLYSVQLNCTFLMTIMLRSSL